MQNTVNKTLVVAFQAIRISGSTKIVQQPRLFAIDSIQSTLILLDEAVAIFVETFRLMWLEELGLYAVNSPTCDRLLQRNESVTSTIGADYKTEKVVDYVLPYTAFDLTPAPLVLNESMNYFLSSGPSTASMYLAERFYRRLTSSSTTNVTFSA